MSSATPASAFHEFGCEMRFIETDVAGAFIVELEPREDQRGFFARMFCQQEFAEHGIDPTIAQINTCLSVVAGTLRGLHFQTEPDADNKFVRCLRGAVLDVCLDLRPDSPTFCQHVAVELNDENRRMLYLPEGCAHGYQTLTNDAEILYTTNRRYSPECASGVRYNDPAFEIQWPLAVTEISAADRGWSDFHR